eukprot:TRINITY_DN58695_c0_g1_i5.p2 TRINITY_DN58695_c0_g1~~TRINITY_DN58695_c0_g1_i5.p2  ORF type:complete len:593 (+),score=134.04 TRINITY_DN58695_c0_g1_i5:2151-3929(+)
MEDSVPIRCPVPDCKKPANHQNVVQLLRQFDLAVASPDHSLEFTYEKTSIQVALASPNKDKTYTCHVCGKYSALYSPGSQSATFQAFQRRKQHWKETVLNELNEQCGLKLKELQREHTNKIEICKELEKTIDSSVEKYIVDLARQRAGVDEKEEKAGTAPRAMTIKERSLLWKLREKQNAHHLSLTEDEKTKLRELEEIADGKPIDKAAAMREQIRTSGEVTKEIACPSLVARLASLRSRDAKSFEEEAKLVTDEFDQKKQSLMERCSNALTVAELNMIRKVFDQSEEDMKADLVGQSESSRFGACGTDGCSGVFCLICELSLNKLDVKDHQCKVDALSSLYSQVIQVLVQASIRTCPKCGTSGQKDLACTHITCKKCASRWCYHCQKLESEVGGFSSHNSWTLDTPRSSPNCPMYLHYKYGDRRNGNQMEGDPEKALIKFHLQLQRAAIEELQKKVQDPVLWSEMVSTYFPSGSIFPVEEVPVVEDNKAQDDQPEQPHVTVRPVIVDGLRHPLLISPHVINPRVIRPREMRPHYADDVDPIPNLEFTLDMVPPSPLHQPQTVHNDDFGLQPAAQTEENHTALDSNMMEFFG